jgi:regulator of RNase E activity RraA
VTVVPGDILLGDEEGVVVIPARYAAEIAEQGPEHEAKETFQRGKILDGLPITEVYPVLSAALDAEWQEAKKSRGF